MLTLYSVCAAVSACSALKTAIMRDTILHCTHPAMAAVATVAMPRHGSQRGMLIERAICVCFLVCACVHVLVF